MANGNILVGSGPNGLLTFRANRLGTAKTTSLTSQTWLTLVLSSGIWLAEMMVIKPYGLGKLSRCSWKGLRLKAVVFVEGEPSPPWVTMMPSPTRAALELMTRLQPCPRWN